ncbi:MAG: S8 family serine peptidase [archaeon]|nr:S8 family serine peptidase [archaeon]
MKKITGVLFLVSLLVISGIAVVHGAGAQDRSARYFVESNNGILKAVFGVQHDFDNGFTTELTNGQRGALGVLGLEVEEVQLYHITAKPGMCGDDSLDPGEKCDMGYPCPEGYICENCKCVCGTPSPEGCEPSTRTPWGVDKVYGKDSTDPYIPNGGAGVIVAVLDTGVERDHPDLNIARCVDATKRKIMKNGCDDKHGHGTHVAGIVAANGGSDGKGIFGVAPNATLWVIRVCYGCGGCWADDIARGIRYAADEGANITSLSLGGSTQDNLIKSAIDHAVSKGVLVIAAAGTYGPDDNAIVSPATENSGLTIMYPAANSKVIAVGAIDIEESVPEWSPKGTDNGNGIIDIGEIEFAAPGVNVESTSMDDCYANMSGTSMAAAHVAGLAAKLWRGNAVTTRADLQTLAKGHDLNETGYDIVTGFGLPIAPNI